MGSQRGLEHAGTPENLFASMASWIVVINLGLARTARQAQACESTCPHVGVYDLPRVLPRVRVYTLCMAVNLGEPLYE